MAQTPLQIKKIFAAVLVLNLFWGLAITHADAVAGASLFFSPGSAKPAVGSQFSVSVFASSPDQPINAASGVIAFDPAKLEIVSLAKDGSIFSLWVQEPTFSNSGGSANFEGIVLNPGFTGTSGKIFTINFRVKTSGNANLNFSSGSVLANDGRGSNILASMGTAAFNLGNSQGSAPSSATPAKPAALPAAPVDKTPAAPEIVSSTHPDQEKWYVAQTVKLAWKPVGKITGLRQILDDTPDTVPDTLKVIPSNSLVKRLDAGVWYVHVRLRNASGWGKTAHFKIQIDNLPPEKFIVALAEGTNINTYQPNLLLNAKDNLSGVVSYKIKIDSADPITVNVTDTGPVSYALPNQKAGKHKILVAAYDKAGNITLASGTFRVKAPFPLTILQYSDHLKPGDVVVARGITPYPDDVVSVSLAGTNFDPKSYFVNAAVDGKFTFVSDDKVNAGNYSLWAQVQDEDNNVIESTDKIPILVQADVQAFNSSWLLIALAVMIPPLSLMLVMSFPLMRGRRKLKAMKAQVREFQDMQDTLTGRFKTLKTDTRGQIKYLMGTKLRRDLTAEEEKVINHLKRVMKIYNDLHKKHLKK